MWLLFENTEDHGGFDSNLTVYYAIVVLAVKHRPYWKKEGYCPLPTKILRYCNLLTYLKVEVGGSSELRLEPHRHSHQAEAS